MTREATLKLGVFALGLVAVFIAAYFLAGVLIPEETVALWANPSHGH